MSLWSELPNELLETIAAHLSIEEKKACTLIHSSWTRVFQPGLFKEIHCAHTEAYQSLVETLLQRHDLASHVRVLDLSRVVGTLKTVKLPDLLRVCPGLREFYVPQAAITSAIIQALSLLTHLRILDLECCIERFEISRVINHCIDLPHLHTLLYPRCSVSTLYAIKGYPPSLEYLALRGGLKDDFVKKLASPSHPAILVTKLMISHAPSITARPALHFLSTLKNLEELVISWPIMRFDHNSLDSLIIMVPRMKRLSIAIDYISPRFFEASHSNITHLTLQFSGVGKHRILAIDDIIEYIDDEAHYPQLQYLALGHKLADLLFKDQEQADSLETSCATRSIELCQVRDSIEDS